MRQKGFQEALNILEQDPVESQTGHDMLADYMFVRGEILDKLGRYKEAFLAYQSASELKFEKQEDKYSVEKDASHFDELRRAFSAENWKALKQIGSQDSPTVPEPIFIVGFPRSGTSLLEQVLGAHPRVIPSGELSYLKDLVDEGAKNIVGSEKPFPDCLIDPEAPLSAVGLKALRRYYLDKVMGLSLHGEQTLWISDKMPHNAMWIGLIALLFPRSPIINISRHPLDACLSAFFANFQSKWHSYTSKLEYVASHYQLMMDLIDHYKTAIDMRYLEVRYQDLIEEQEMTVRSLLKFLNLEWSDECLRHQKSRRLVKTASYEQITQPIYTSSLNRYKNYWDEVQPIIPMLKPLIERYGYSLESS